MDSEISAERLKRKLAVILASDVAGYSRLVSISEDDAIGRFRKAAQTFAQIIQKHEGRVFNTAGDAILAEFSSAVNAIRCSIDFQSVNDKENLGLPQEQRLLFRIGIAVGDVIVHDNMDLLGESVNIAARLQVLAEPGGICVSEDIKNYVGNKLPLRFDDLGWRELRNMPAPVHVFRAAPSHAARYDQAVSRSGFANLAKPAMLLLGGAVAAVMLMTAAFMFWRADNGIRNARPDSREQQKTGAHKFDASVIPLVRDGVRRSLADYASRPDAKALAISNDGLVRVVDGFADPEGAKSDALQRCRTASHRLCRLYAVGLDVVWPADLLQLPLDSDVHADPIGLPLVPAEIPVLNDVQRRRLEQNLAEFKTYKALMIDRMGRHVILYTEMGRAEAVRVAIERCAAQLLAPCLLIGFDGQLTVQLPKSRRVNRIFMVTTEEGMSAEDRQRIGEIYRRKEWRALARGKSGKWYAVADAPSESEAVDAAIRTCAQTETACKLHAIGNFRVADE
jgi:class 3 adenylate cyclase